MRALSLSLALLAGCAATVAEPPVRPLVTPQAVPVSLAVPDPGPELYDVLVDAGRILGWPLELTDDGHEQGAITVLLVDVASESAMAGYALVTDGCARGVMAEPVGQVVAHEIGHALGLHHTSVVGNLMFPLALEQNVELTDEQRQTMESELVELVMCE